MDLYDERFFVLMACVDLSLGSSVASDCGGTLHSHWTVSCASGYFAMDDAVFKCLAPPGIPDGLLPRCVSLVCTGQELDGLEGIAHQRRCWSQ